MGETPEDETDTVLPRDLRFLKTLVTVLTVVMIAGVITITALLVIRLNGGSETVLIDPGGFELPEGVGIVGLSVVGDSTVIVGDDGTIRVFDTADRTLRQQVRISD